MKSSSISELKKELSTLPPAELVEIILRMAKFKKDSKELLHYLLFEAHHPDGYIETVKNDIDQEFEGISTNPYHAKKTLRKILRITTKHIRFAGSKEAEAELLLHFCKKMRRCGLKVDQSVQLANLYAQQLKKIGKAIDALHEDLQYDLRRQLDALTFA
ncbi:hypothetical protein ACWKWU_22130 [Chitinophaga lutea]